MMRVRIRMNKMMKVIVIAIDSDNGNDSGN